MSRRGPHRDKKYLAFVRSHPCVVCGRSEGVQAAHYRAGGDGGLGQKPSDYRATPLCAMHHQAQHDHQLGENHWWKTRGIDPKGIVFALMEAWITKSDVRWPKDCANEWRPL